MTKETIKIPVGIVAIFLAAIAGFIFNYNEIFGAALIILSAILIY